MALIQVFFFSTVWAVASLATGWLGIELEESDAGPSISKVVADSPADKAGLRIGDLITGINGTPMREIDDIIDAFEVLDVGELVTFGLRRGGKEMVRKIRLAHRPAEDGNPRQPPAGQAKKPARPAGRHNR